MQFLFADLVSFWCRVYVCVSEAYVKAQDVSNFMYQTVLRLYVRAVSKYSSMSIV